MQVILIGPSGVGKTTLANYLSKKFKLQNLNLDEVFNYHGVKTSWALFKSTLDKSLSHKNIIIDIGSGFNKYPGLPKYLKSLRVPVLLIYADPRFTYKRTPWGKNRKLKEYTETDYIEDEALYKVANFKVDVSSFTKRRVKKNVVRLIQSEIQT